MRSLGLWKLLMLVALASGPTTSLAQEPGPATPEPATREAAIEQAQAEKGAALQPYVPGKGEKYLEPSRGHHHQRRAALASLLRPALYRAAAFTLGAGLHAHVEPLQPARCAGVLHLLRLQAGRSGVHRAARCSAAAAQLSLLGGWREATQVGFYGIGTGPSRTDRVNYGFQQPYGSATIKLRPTRRLLVLRGGLEASQWQQTSGPGAFPSVETVYTPATLPGLGADVHLPPFARHGRASTGARPPATRGAAASTA